MGTNACTAIAGMRFGTEEAGVCCVELSKEGVWAFLRVVISTADFVSSSGERSATRGLFEPLLTRQVEEVLLINPCSAEEVLGKGDF